MQHTRRIPSCAALVGAAASLLALCGVAEAALRSEAPEGVDLGGRWKVILELSEDPRAVVESVRTQLETERNERELKRSSDESRRRGTEDDDIALPEKVPPGSERPPPKTERKSRFPWLRPRIGVRGAGAELSPDMLDRIEHAISSPEEFALQQERGAMVFVLPESVETCKTGRAARVASPLGGTGEQRCGWERKAFVVETTSDSSPTLSVRYELDQESGRLVVTSGVKGERIPLIQVKRLYERTEP